MTRWIILEFKNCSINLGSLHVTTNYKNSCFGCGLQGAQTSNVKTEFWIRS
jgi:hypothetical protein